MLLNRIEFPYNETDDMRSSLQRQKKNTRTVYKSNLFPYTRIVYITLNFRRRRRQRDFTYITQPDIIGKIVIIVEKCGRHCCGPSVMP
ncbi:hypothetical protein EVAR_51888_1 [Eumeta japonica]|uniref:Uncharacterized protein n=1 Tax=Eumeta variegata TaxID=151549 RepID=A0A4C1XI44_EUMVA|nr:hypothetical protein EVAR_51888_1 [Eumeta japonica]